VSEDGGVSRGGGASRDGGASGRPARLWVGLLLNGGARALVVAAPLVTLPLVTGSLGRTTYGAYAVIAAIATLLPWADLGVGLGMVTAVARASGRHDDAEVRAVVSTGLALLLSVGGVLLLLTAVLATTVDWRTALGVTDPGVVGDVGLAAVVVLLAFAAGIPAGLGTKLMLGLQMNRALAFWQAAAVPAVVLAVVVAYLAGAGLPWFLLATVGSPVLVALAGTLWLFGRARPDLAPRFALARSREVRALLALGLVFSVNSAAATIGFATDSIVISHVLGVDAVAVYNIGARLSAVALLVYQGLLLPLWPVFGAGLAAREYVRTRALLRRAVLISLGAGAVTAVVFVAATPGVVRLWVGGEYVPSTGLLVALAAWSLVQFAAYPFALLFSGAGAMRLLLWTALAMAAANLPLSIVLAHTVGIAGPAWASCVSIAVCVLLPSVYAANRYAERPVREPVAEPAVAP
jgi:O-antigen/teichoic acid export membrane protein